jgi:LPS export ABC transporter protein LptC
MKQPGFGSKISKIINTICIAALISGAAILFYACENNLEQIKAFSPTENLPVLEALNFETTATDSGVIRYFLKAPKLLRFEIEGESYFEFPEGIELVRYNENNQIISRITANYAKQFEKDLKWEAKNNVIATNAQGDTLKTELLYYDEKEGKIYTEEFVRIIRPDQTITGIGFQSDQSLQNWRIKNPKGTFYVSVENQNNSQPITNEEFTNEKEGNIQPSGNPVEF